MYYQAGMHPDLWVRHDMVLQCYISKRNSKTNVKINPNKSTIKWLEINIEWLLVYFKNNSITLIFFGILNYVVVCTNI